MNHIPSQVIICSTTGERVWIHCPNCGDFNTSARTMKRSQRCPQCGEITERIERPKQEK